MGLTVTALALTCFVLLAAGYGLFLALERNERLAPVVRDAWPILHTETLIVGAAAGAFWIDGWLLIIALLALAWRTGYEAATVAARRAALPAPVFLGAAMAFLGLLASLLPMVALVITALLALVACGALSRSGRFPADSAQAVGVELVLFPGVPLIVFTAAGLNGGYGVWLLAAFILVETFDSYALLGGKLFGKTRAFPVLSPNKTVEGLATGAAMLMLTAALAGALLAGLPVLATSAVALFAGALTLAGDLTASRLKRRSGVKDYPAILPHQGGLLDITDAWITAGAGLVALAALLGLG